MSEEIILKVGVSGTGDGEQKIKSLKSQLKEMKNELMGLDEGSDRFKKLSKEAAELQDHIGDVSDKVKALSSDTKRLDALVGVGSAIAGGFQAAQGAMALFGSNSKEVEKAIQNIIAVQGVLNGVQQVGQFLTSKGIVQDAIYGAGKKAIALGTAAWTAAQWLLNAAMTANPIGLLIAGIALLGAGIAALIKWYDKVILVAKAWMGIFDAQLLKEAQAEKDRSDRRSKEADAHTERLKEIDAEKKAKVDSIDKTISALELEKETLEAQGKSSDEVTIKILEAEKEKTIAVLEANKAKIQSWTTYYENLAALSGQSEEEFKATMKGRGIDLDALQKKSDELIAQNEVNIQHSENAITKFKREQHEKRVSDHKDTVEEIDRLNKQEIERLDQDNVIIKEKEKSKYDYMAQMGAMVVEQEAERRKKIKDLEEKEFQEFKDRQDAKFKTAQNFAKASIDLANTIFTITNALGKQDEASKLKRAKRQFEINKALSIADATISTINGVVNALTEKSLLPAPLSTIMKAGNAIAIAAAGAANIAKISAQKFDGGTASPTLGGGGDAGGSVSNVGNTTPNINAIPAGSTLLNKDTQKVVVVESDITKTQKKVNVIEAANTFG
jgi:hypothetical protein